MTETVYLSSHKGRSSKRYHTKRDCPRLKDQVNEKRKQPLIDWGYEKCAYCEQGTDAYNDERTEQRRSLRKSLIAKGELDYE